MSLRPTKCKTNEGTYTLHSVSFDESYHSHTGGVTESQHIYIDNGLRSKNLRNIFEDGRPLSILELGFGSGLNLLLTHCATATENSSIFYHTLEPFPLLWEEVSSLGFEDFLSLNTEFRSFFKKAHSSEWNKTIALTPNLTVLKSKSSLESVDLEKNAYNLVYFSAFSPKVQESIWSSENFQKIHKAMKHRESLLITYSCQRLVKENLRSAQFNVSRLKGVFPKRHMLRAVPQSQIR